MRLVTRVVLAVILVAPTAAAQSAGTWGAEAASGPSASLLRFRSATSAWVVSATGQLQKIDVRDSAAAPTVSETQTVTSEVRVGLRRYASTDTRLRSYSTWSGIIAYEESSFQKGWGFGAAGEVGAAHFFSENVSLGVSADLSVTYRPLKRNTFSISGPLSVDISVTTIRFSGLRLVGGVYF